MKRRKAEATIRVAGYAMSEAAALERLSVRYPDARVEVVTFSADVYERIVLSEAGRSEAGNFDLYDISFPQTKRVAPWFEDVSELASRPPADSSDPLFRHLLDQLSTADGRVAGAPWRCSSYVLAYRRDIARRLALPPPDTIPRAIDLARAAHERLGLYGYAAAKRGALHQALDWLPFLWEFGGEVLRDGRVVLDSPEAVRALSAYVELSRFSAWQSLEFEYDDPVSALLDGAAVMAQAWCGDFQELLDTASRPDDFGFLPGLGAPVRGGGGLGIPRSSESRNRAAAFLRWLLDPGLDAERVALGGTAIYDSTASRLPQDMRSSICRASRESYRKGRDRPHHPEWPAIQRVLARVAREAQTGEVALRGLLAEAAEEIRTLDSAASSGSGATPGGL